MTSRVQFYRPEASLAWGIDHVQFWSLLCVFDR